MEDLDEWEVLPEDGFLEIHHDDGAGNKFFSRKYTTPSDSVFKNYFTCPSPKQSSSKFMQPSAADKADCRVAKQFIPVPIRLEPEHDQISKEGSTDKISSPVTVPDDLKKMVTAETDQDLFSQQVFFKKETEFVDMKLDSPKSNHGSRGMKPPPQMVQFEAAGGEGQETIKISSTKVMKVVDEDKMMMTNDNNMDTGGDADDAKKEATWNDDDDDQNSGGINNIFKWSLTGIGAICSFGVATVCILVMGGLIKNPNGNTKTQHHRHQQRQDQPKLQFHIYAEDKRLKQVVQQASRWNEAMSAVGGVPYPFTRAHITSGGYYDSR